MKREDPQVEDDVEEEVDNESGHIQKMTSQADGGIEEEVEDIDEPLRGRGGHRNEMAKGTQS